MQSGSIGGVSTVIQALVQKKPRKVAHLGIGFGFYGAAIRNWLDAGVQPYRTYLVGVERYRGYSGNQSPCWDLYDRIHEVEIEHWLHAEDQAAERFDAILLIDVLDHCEFREGRQLLLDLRSRLFPGGQIIVATWAELTSGGPIKAIWHEAHLEELGFTILTDGLKEHGSPGLRMVVGVYAKPN